jgi:hypothetical protein
MKRHAADAQSQRRQYTNQQRNMATRKRPAETTVPVAQRRRRSRLNGVMHGRDESDVQPVKSLMMNAD